MVDPPTYRTQPDPEFADRLETVLLRRLTAANELPPTGQVARSGESARTLSEPGHRAADHLIVLETDDRAPGHGPVPDRRSPGRWFLAAAVAVAVGVAGTLLVAAGDDDADEQIDTVTSTPSTEAPPHDATPAPEPSALEPRSVDPDGTDATPLRVTYQVPAGWGSWFGAIKFVEGDADGFTGLSITTVSNLVADGCRDHTALDPPVGPTVDDLATALSQLAPFEVTAPPTDVTLLGYQGKRLELTVPALKVTGSGDATSSKNVAQFTDCVEGELHSWISPINDRSAGLLGHSAGSPLGAFNAYQAPGQTEEFWILDVDGTRLVIVKFDSPLSPAADIAERNAMFDSIRIEP